jgi:hypothetical protein
MGYPRGWIDDHKPATPGMAERLFQGWPPAGHRVVGHGGLAGPRNTLRWCPWIPNEIRALSRLRRLTDHLFDDSDQVSLFRLCLFGRRPLGPFP